MFTLLIKQILQNRRAIIERAQFNEGWNNASGDLVSGLTIQQVITRANRRRPVKGNYKVTAFHEGVIGALDRWKSEYQKGD